MKIWRILVLVAALLALIPTAALAANESIDAQMFRPSIFNGHFLAIEDARTLDAWCGGFGLYFNYADSLVELKDQNSKDFKSGVLEQASSLNLTAALGLFRWMSIGVDVPYHVAARGKNLTDIEDQGVFATKQDNISTLGDIKAELKLGILNEEKNKAIGLALAGFATFPTGDPEYFLGEGTTNFGGKLMLEHDFKIFNIGLNGGYLVRPSRDILNTQIGNAYLFGAGLSRDWKSGFGFSIEYWGSQFDSASNKQLQANPMEVTGTLRYKFGAGPRVIGGGGAGFGGGVGSPPYRVIAGIDYYPECNEETEGKLRVCVTDPDGTPLPSALAVDSANPFKVDTEADGCYQAVVAPGLYSVTGSKSGYDSASDTGVVKTGKTTQINLVLTPHKVTTLLVKVVIESSGAPVPGAMVEVKAASGTSTHTMSDKGEWDAGVYPPGSINLKNTSPGYTDGAMSFNVLEGQANVAVIKVKKKIIPIGKVYFAWDSDVILPKSYPVLDGVLEAIKAETDFQSLMIEGHCSTEGTVEHNQDLSERRAASVRKWLVQHGIDDAKLNSIGYGESKPIIFPDDTEELREQNRRVEFILN